ncbi:NADH:ubiquinone reductase (Na(+)-transporting) subunit F [Raineyella fluvialis]|uniref:2Fe-2S iron-sulfur cluster binding domain-containing protein n=1 Tax=Raineyella fluvialis TaxID=2662261 RepID=A0A5Q2FGQ8_9ACTN|nr:2Fe-2S iron-sulfur cluster-binding protein [Raineyella fluvialis]QGF23486.1 2Fe-2S iron-sulfur cluster binding domain-containing protein [Raineyella fluvialis]
MSHTVTVEPLGREVEVADDQTILEACLRAGVWLPHSCTHGTCATCKVEVLDGDVDHGEASSFALMDFEREEGKTLTCCARPQTDVTIEADIDVDEELEIHPVEDFTGTIVELSDIAHDIKRLRIELDRDLHFNAGQYMRVIVPGTDGIDRTWSMANSPSENRIIEFQVRNVPGGVATDGWLFKDAALGDSVQLSGPYGRFVLRTWEEEKPVVMLGGGTGLAPLASMVKHALLDEAYDGHITLYAGGRTVADLYDVDVFRAMEEEYPDQFTFHPCVSAEEPPEGYRAGFVSTAMEEDFDKLTGYQGYMCGSPAMVEGCLKSFMSRRLFPRDIFHEDFFNEGDKQKGVGSPLIKR